MTRILLHIGLPRCGAEPLQAVLDDKRGQLAQKGVLYAGSIGRKNHTKLYMAASDPAHVDPMRYLRGFAEPAAQERLSRMVIDDLAREIEREKPELLVLSAPQLATLPNTSELERLRDLLRPLGDEIAVVAHVDEQARVLLRYYEEAVNLGRATPLDQELALADAPDWRAAALADWARITPANMGFPELQGAPHWLDYAFLHDHWQQVFGPGQVRLRPYDEARFHSGAIVDEIRDMLELDGSIGKAEPAPPAPRPSASTLARWRQLNAVFGRLLDTGRFIPRVLWGNLLGEVALPGGAPTEPGALAALSARFAPGNRALAQRFPALAAALEPDAPAPPWTEAAPERGFRATQYAAAFLPRIEQATQTSPLAAANAALELAERRRSGSAAARLSPTAERLMSERAKENWAHLKTGRFAPHNRLGQLDETVALPPYPEVPRRALRQGDSGNVIVSCMKNEAPYILEWIAYHRAIGVDNFIVYTNDCTDGTDEILDRLEAMGLLQHRLNNDWKGNSPQQHALNKAVKEDLLKQAEWIIHIDVDEFINVRVGDGTLADFLAEVPGATNVAMTWRLFGHNGVEDFRDELVIGQFTQAAPRYCPKPHTTWGFKTMTRNIGAYAKLSCHRPNHLGGEHEAKVRWVNGNGQPMPAGYLHKGWRSDLKSIGYDKLQLNHYALRSAESFLVKRQRGRALHVDRSIGLNYWIRMDWGGNEDVTILRNVPRVRAELDRLLADPELARLHAEGVAWHRDKAIELRATPEFAELYAQALTTDLTEMERVAFALALDMES